jgi:hypothetical protein
MIRFQLLLAAVLAVVLCSPISSLGQTDLTLPFAGMQGVERTTPYVTYETLENATVNGEISLGALLAAESVEEITAALGKPDSLVEAGSRESGNFHADLHYDGAKIHYIWRSSETHGISSVDLTSAGWSFTIDGVIVRPGMPASELSDPVRRFAALEKPFNRTADKHVGSISITMPNTDASGNDDVMQGGHAGFSLIVDMREETVVSVHFTRPM